MISIKDLASVRCKILEKDMFMHGFMASIFVVLYIPFFLLFVSDFLELRLSELLFSSCITVLLTATYLLVYQDEIAFYLNPKPLSLKELDEILFYGDKETQKQFVEFYNKKTSWFNIIRFVKKKNEEQEKDKGKT